MALESCLYYLGRLHGWEPVKVSSTFCRVEPRRFLSESGGGGQWETVRIPMMYGLLSGFIKISPESCFASRYSEPRRSLASEGSSLSVLQTPL